MVSTIESVEQFVKAMHSIKIISENVLTISQKEKKFGTRIVRRTSFFALIAKN
jgi:hypothetical protein